jgi:hypothetical protein
MRPVMIGDDIPFLFNDYGGTAAVHATMILPIAANVTSTIIGNSSAGAGSSP